MEGSPRTDRWAGGDRERARGKKRAADGDCRVFHAAPRLASMGNAASSAEDCARTTCSADGKENGLNLLDPCVPDRAFPPGPEAIVTPHTPPALGGHGLTLMTGAS